jgi:hypothetical protein
MSMPMAMPNAGRIGITGRFVGAAVGLSVRVALRLVDFDKITALMRRVAVTPRRSATPAETLRVLRAVDAGAAVLPVRVACLERSLATVLILAARRRGATWCMGVRTPPVTMHAWVADDTGEPVGEPASTREYKVLLQITPTMNRSTT